MRGGRERVSERVATRISDIAKVREKMCERERERE